MRMQAVVKIGGAQHLVTPGQILTISAPEGTTGNMSFDQVLLVVDGDKVEVGKPFVDGIKVNAEVVGISSYKIRVAKYKAKSRYHKVYGSKTVLTKIKINTIGDGKVAAPAKVEVAAAPAPKKAPVKAATRKAAPKKAA